MRISRGLSPAIALMSVWIGVTAGGASPPHPTGLMVTYQRASHLVVAVEKEDPVIELDGKRKRLRGTVPLTTERLPAYAAATATFGPINISGVEIVEASSEAEVSQVSQRATVAGFVEFSSTITANQDLADCFLALVAFEKDFLADASRRPNAQIRIRQLPALKAGEAHAVKFSTSPFLGRDKLAVFALLFSGGREVRSNVSPGAGPYFHQRERAVHAAVVARWLDENRGTSRPAQPVLQIPPQFPSTEGFPRTVSATLTIAPTGQVSTASLNGDLPGPGESILLSTLQGWLFLPKIQDGVATTARVTVPFNF